MNDIPHHRCPSMPIFPDITRDNGTWHLNQEYDLYETHEQDTLSIEIVYSPWCGKEM